MTEQPTVNVDALIAQSRARSVQSDQSSPEAGGVYTVNWIARAGAYVPSWWSVARDTALRKFWKKGDHLSGAIYAMESKMTAIPRKVVPRDPSIKEYQEQADYLSAVIEQGAQFGEGWEAFFGRFVEDLLCLAGNTRVHLGGARRGETKSIARIVADKDPGPVLSINNKGRIVEREVNQWHTSPLRDRRWWWVSTENASGHSGKSRGGIFMTEDHPIQTENGWVAARDIKVGTMIATGDPTPSNEQMEVLIGGLLGDMGVGKIRKRSILRFAHSIKQEEWLDLKLHSLLGFQWTGRNYRKNDKYDSKTVSLNSRGSLGLNKLRDRWYPKGRKVVNREDVERYFSPRMMAVWFCDDGSKHRNFTRAGNETTSHGSLYTCGFTKSDNEWLAGFLAGRGFPCKVKKQGKYYALYLTPEAMRNLAQFIGSYVPPSMRYKLVNGAPSYDSDNWNLESALPYYDKVVASEARDYTSGYRVVQTTYHIGVEETRNFIAANINVHNTQDNGAFAEIIGDGPKTGPIIGAPLSIAHLDSHRCTRTGNIEYPVVYTNTDGNRYKLHYSRVLFVAQMASPIKEMHGVGFCAVSRAINVAQTLIDILHYKQEKLGSRPQRALIVTQGGLDPRDVQTGFQLAETATDNMGLSRYSKIVLAGLSTLPEADLKMFNLAELPDGFDEETSITLGMATIALALGVDARELFPAMSAGATRADALLQHIKQRGKGPGQIIQMVEKAFDAKFLPPHLHLNFDFQDDAQDRQVAEIRNLRAEGTERNINTGALNTRVSREQMMDNGDLTRSQFERLELQDGRLPNGNSLLTLFYSKNPAYKKFLNLGVADPLNIFAQDMAGMQQVIVEKMQAVAKAVADEKDPDKRNIAVQCIYALAVLQKLYAEPTPENIAIAFSEGNINTGLAATPEDNRTRTLNPGRPNENESLNEQGRYGLKPSYDDKRPADQ